jgi:hypothetical protein
VLRPPFAQERLRLRDDGRVVLELKTAWHDGTTQLCSRADQTSIQAEGKIVAVAGA